MRYCNTRKNILRYIWYLTYLAFLKVFDISDIFGICDIYILDMFRYVLDVF